MVRPLATRAASLAILASAASAAHADCPSGGTKVLVHYMIWFGEPGTRHWVWCNRSYFDPKSMGCNNTQHLATRFPPVGGAFASYDPEHVASDVALMKSHCIDGIIIDYQHPPDHTGQSIINRSLAVAVDAIVDAGLQFAIMYDASSRQDWGRASSQAAGVAADWHLIISLAAAQRSSYLRDAEGNLMFFLFGVSPPPAGGTECPGCAFYSQDANGHSTLDAAPGKPGAFAWVEPPKGPPVQFLRDFYSRKCSSLFPHSPTPCVGAAYVGMEAVYPQHGSIQRSAVLLRQGLDLCAEHGVVCQVPTWNDFNEGTHVQPSYWCNGHEPSYYLQVIKDFKMGNVMGVQALVDGAPRLWPTALFCAAWLALQLLRTV